MNPPNVHLQKAFDLFLGELDSHLEFFQSSLASLEESKLDFDQIDDLQAGLSNRFHLIRGAAGFLQLEAIRDFAKEAEIDLKKTAYEQPDLLAKLKELVAQLSQFKDQTTSSAT